MANVRITVSKTGSYKVEVDGTLELVDHEGNPIPFREGKPIYLCRCGGSEKKPFCDGAHSRIGFLGAEAAVKAAREQEEGARTDNPSTPSPAPVTDSET